MIRALHLLTLSLLLMTLSSFAQPRAEQDVTVLNKILAKQSQVAGTFEQAKHLAILPMPIRSSGEFSFTELSGLNWTVLKPVHSQMVLDDQGIRQIQEGKVVWALDASQPAASHISTIIASVLAADWQTLNKHFDLSHTLTGTRWDINLQPTSQVLLTAVKRITLTGEQVLEKMTLFEANGDSTVIQFDIRNSQP